MSQKVPTVFEIEIGPLFTIVTGFSVDLVEWHCAWDAAASQVAGCLNSVEAQPLCFPAEVTSKVLCNGTCSYDLSQS